MTGIRGTKLIPQLEAAYLKAAIESGQNERAKRALQTLCKLYWNGSRLLPNDRNGVENTVLGALASGNSDEKVRRWSLSGLAQFGKPTACWHPVVAALTAHQSEPQVVSAAIAAAFKLKPENAHTELIAMDFVSPEILAISALQSIPASMLRGGAPKIDVDSASATTLKLALVLVGLDRAPENLFHPSYTNSELVRALGAHHESLVSQYSVWAVAENPSLSARDLGIDPLTVEARSSNVRSYIYRLFASERTPSELQHQLIEAGSQDHVKEARMGCAIGLRETWYDGLEPIVIDWFLNESDQDVQRYLLDHLVRQAPRSASYENLSLELFKSYEGNSDARQVMKVAASGGMLFSQLKRLEFEEEQGFLIKQERTMNTYNNNINVQNYGVMGQAAVSAAGDASANGDAKGQVTTTAPELIREIRHILSAAPIPTETQDHLEVALAEAEADPSPSRLQRLVDLLERCKEGLEAVDGITATTTALAGRLALLAALTSGLGG